jgi:hypothetical protein
MAANLTNCHSLISNSFRLTPTNPRIPPSSNSFPPLSHKIFSRPLEAPPAGSATSSSKWTTPRSINSTWPKATPCLTPNHKTSRDNRGWRVLLTSILVLQMNSFLKDHNPTTGKFTKCFKTPRLI